MLPQEAFGHLCAEDVSVENIAENCVDLEAKDPGLNLQFADM